MNLAGEYEVRDPAFARLSSTGGTPMVLTNRTPSTDMRAVVRGLGTIVGVLAHPDDEAYLSAGLMAGAAETGNRVVCVTATRGELGTSDPARWPPARLAPARERELLASLAAVGVDEHRWLPYQDGACATEDPAQASRLVRQVLDEVGADTVVTFGPDGMTGHTDHVAVGRWAAAAAAGARKRPRLLHATKTIAWRDTHDELHRRLPIFGPEGPPAVEPGRLALALELRGDSLDRKIAALVAHTSQTTELRSMMGESVYRAWAADEYFVEALP
jgi:LmbE family N-acetylglucosaminyl deacetylase